LIKTQFCQNHLWMQETWKYIGLTLKNLSYGKKNFSSGYIVKISIIELFFHILHNGHSLNFFILMTSQPGPGAAREKFYQIKSTIRIFLVKQSFFPSDLQVREGDMLWVGWVRLGSHWANCLKRTGRRRTVIVGKLL